ncbi:MAG: hypothetical protein A2017_04700 [Lentisphaerae bacterium GWF2_44_16]|nr:MAG: hypothetical protein A2017_04700 [Lentisphaerae bacterium GWF2_44_16]
MRASNLTSEKSVLTILLTCVILVLSFSSLLSAENDKAKKNKAASSPSIHFPALKDYRISFEVISSRREFYLEEDIFLTFKLQNISDKPLLIYEWMMNEPDNVKIYYRLYDENIKEFIESEWECLNPEIKQPVKRAVLDLNPQNSVFIDKEMSFVKKLKLSALPKGGAKYYVIGVLNLKSISAKSHPVVIRIK